MRAGVHPSLRRARLVHEGATFERRAFKGALLVREGATFERRAFKGALVVRPTPTKGLGMNLAARSMCVRASVGAVRP
jgi:hypothetical protein